MLNLTHNQQNLNKDVFNLTYFKQKKNYINDINQINKKDESQNPKIDLQKIQQKIQKYVITPISTKSNNNKVQKNKSIQLFTRTYHSKSNSLGNSICNEELNKIQHITHQTINLQPLTLKKKFNIIRKQKNILQDQLFTNQTMLKHQQRTLQKSWRSLSLYKTKLDKISMIRQVHNKQKQSNYKQKILHQKMLRNTKISLKNTVLGTRSNLSMSKLSVYEQKKKIASRIRKDSNLMSQQLKIKNKIDIQNKKNVKQCIKTCENIWLDSIRQWKQQKKLTINQKKLHEITVEINSLQKQNNINDTFYRQKQLNNPYRNRIREKKIQIERKLKQYKQNLMLVLNTSQKFNPTENQEDRLDFSQIKETKDFIIRKKRLSVISTQPDHLDQSYQSLKYRNSIMVSNRC